MISDIKNRYKYGVTRADVYKLHVIFSDFMLGKLKYMYDQVDELEHVPSKLSEQGDEIGTLEKSEWKSILGEIIYAFEYDVYGNDEEMPEDVSEVGEYLTESYEKEFRYKRGLRLLGVYYSHLWG